MADHDWVVEVKVKPSTTLHKQLLHLPEVVAQLTQIAAGIAEAAGQGHSPGSFGIRVQNKPNTKRARALAHPTSNGGIHLQLTQHVLEKAAASHGTKQITTKATPQAIQMANRPVEAAATVTGTTITPIDPAQIPPPVR